LIATGPVGPVAVGVSLCGQRRLRQGQHGQGADAGRQTSHVYWRVFASRAIRFMSAKFFGFWPVASATRMSIAIAPGLSSPLAVTQVCASFCNDFTVVLTTLRPAPAWARARAAWALPTWSVPGYPPPYGKAPPT